MPSARVSIRRVAAVECHILGRAVGWPLLLGLFGIAALLLVQEPEFARRYEVIPFVGSGFESALVGASIATPLVWVLLRRPSSMLLVVRPAATVVGWTLGITAFAAAVGAVALAPLIALDRISIRSAAALVIRLVLLTASFAAVAPALASLRPSGGAAVFSWSCLVAASLGIFGIGLPIPADRVLGDLGSTMPSGPVVAASVLSLLAGLSVSTVAVGRRLSSG